MKAYKLINITNDGCAFEKGSVPINEHIDATHFFGVRYKSWGVMSYANNLWSLKRKNLTSVTPLRFALKPLIFELNDSALAFVFLLLKKFKIPSKWCSNE